MIMTPTRSPEVKRALKLIAKGTPLRVAAREVGVACSTLMRARQADKLPPLKRGRPSTNRVES